MNISKKLNLSAFILGLSSMISQIIVLRELIVVFYGNELSSGIILASWFFWVAVGSGLAGRLPVLLRRKERTLSDIQVLTAFILPLNIFFIRGIKTFLHIPPGKIMGFTPIIGGSFLSLSVICVSLGLTFTLISKCASEKSKSPASGVSKAYLFEGLGASIGGLLFSFALIKIFTPFQNAFILGLINILASLLFIKSPVRVLYAAGLTLTIVLNYPSSLEKYTRSLEFRPFKLIETADSIYGNIAVVENGHEYSFYENGLLLFTTGDLLTSEESVHYSMLEHPSPEKVLLIGGGIGGSLKEILKHPVQKVDYVELDPLIIKLAEKYTSLPKDKRLNIINSDGRLFVKKKALELQAEKGAYSVVILNLPDPYTAMLNRFYSMEFFGEVKKILAPGGVFSFALSSSENYINPEQGYYLASIYNTLKKEFRDVKIFPGDTATFISSDKETLLTYDPEVLITRLGERNISAKFVREYYLPFKLSPSRIKYMEDALEEFKSAKINRDFRPIGYFYHLKLWMSLFRSGKIALSDIEKINIWIFAAIISVLFLAALAAQKLKKLSVKTPVMISVGTTGMSEICFQIIVILAFQFLYGYVYYKIGLILTSFMIGLVAGTFCITRLLGRIKDEKALFIKTQIAICLYPLTLPLIFTYIKNINLTNPGLGNSLQFTFTMLPVIAGFIGGFQFPLANKICMKNHQDAGKTAGFLYGIDLLGSCVGGLLAGLLLVPVIGIIQTCALLSILNTFVLILFFSHAD